MRAADLVKRELSRRKRQTEAIGDSVLCAQRQPNRQVAIAIGVGAEDERNRHARFVEQRDLLLRAGGNRHRLGHAVELQVAEVFLLDRHRLARAAAGNDDAFGHRHLHRRGRWRGRCHRIGVELLLLDIARRTLRPAGQADRLR